jgi:hypothetical protein
MPKKIKTPKLLCEPQKSLGNNPNHCETIKLGNCGPWKAKAAPWGAKNALWGQK